MEAVPCSRSYSRLQGALGLKSWCLPPSPPQDGCWSGALLHPSPQLARRCSTPGQGWLWGVRAPHPGALWVGAPASWLPASGRCLRTPSAAAERSFCSSVAWTKRLFSPSSAGADAGWGAWAGLGWGTCPLPRSSVPGTFLQCGTAPGAALFPLLRSLSMHQPCQCPAPVISNYPTQALVDSGLPVQAQLMEGGQKGFLAAWSLQ